MFHKLVFTPAVYARERQLSRRNTWLLNSSRVSSLIVVGFFIAMFVVLVYGSRLSMVKFGFGFLWNDAWNPITENFGGLSQIYGTIITSILAMTFALPMGLGVAWVLSQFVSDSWRSRLSVGVSLLAGIPSIVYGIVGFFVFAPFMQEYVQPWLIDMAAPVPLLNILFTGPPYGVGTLTAALILAAMILPIIASTSTSAFVAVDKGLKESAYSLGCTDWEVFWDFTLPRARTSVFGGSMLALGRALGETMAVAFVMGNAHHIHASLIAPGTTISATIANEFSEAVSDMYLSSIIELSVILLIISFVVLALSNVLLRRVQKQEGI